MAVNAGVVETILKLRDEMSSKLDIARANVTAFAQRNAASFAAIGKAAGAAVGAIGAAGAAIIAMGQKGAAIADVGAAFESLARDSGGAEAVLASLRKGVVNTVSDFELMKMANSAMGAGLAGSAKDFEVLSAGARMLAKRVGGDTVQSFQTMTTAMASGRTASLKSLGLFVDSAAAIDRYAAANNILEAEMTDADRAAALQAETLSVLRRELEENAPAAADFGERLEQAKVRMANFYDALAVAVANSPVIAVAFEEMGKAAEEAFGSNRQEAVNTFGDIVGKIAIFLVDVATVAVKGARLITNAWHGLNYLFNKVAEGVLNLAGYFAQGISKIAEVASKLPKVGKHFEGVAETLKSVAEDSFALADGFEAQAEGHLDNAAKTEAAFGKVTDALGNMRAAMVKAQGSQTQATSSTDQMNDKLRVNAEAARKAAEANKKLQEEVDKLGKSISDYDPGTSFQWDTREALGLDEAIMSTEELFGVLDQVPIPIKEMEEEAKRAAAQVKELTKYTIDWNMVLQGSTLIAGALGAEFSDVVNVIGNVADAFDKAKTSSEQFLAVASGVGQLGGLIGGKAGGLLQGAAGGAMTGAGIGKMFGPVGGIIGGAIGGIAGGISSLFGGDKEIMQVNDLRDAYIDAAGGFEALAHAAGEAAPGLDLVKQLLDAKSVQEYEAAIASLDDAFSRPAQAQEALNAAVERYGFSIEELGPKFRQQELDTMAGQLIQDFQLLTASGIENATVLERMAPAMNEYVQTAVASGASVPEAMRGQIEKMAELGLLVDENGEAYKSAEDAGITFAESMTESLARTIEAIDKLVAALGGVVAPPPINIPVTYDIPNFPGGGGIPKGFDQNGIPQFQHGTGGFMDFGTGTLVALHGREAVIRERDVAPAPSDNSEISNMIASLPGTISKAVRDGMLLAQ